jgi:hypothetical protein
MIEILVLIGLTKSVGNKAKDKGYGSGGYKLLTVVLWFGGEILGLLLGAMVTGGEGGIGIYVCALLGAGIGAWIAHGIVDRLPNKKIYVASSSSWTCPSCQAANTSYDKTLCSQCGAPRPQGQDATSVASTPGHPERGIVQS